MKALSPCCRAGGLLSPCWSLPGHKELVCWAAASVVYLMGTRFGEGWKIKVKWARRRKLHPFFPFGRINRLLLSTSLHSRSDVGSREGIYQWRAERLAYVLEPLRSPLNIWVKAEKLSKWARRRKLHPFFPFGRINRLLLSTSLHSRSDVGSREGIIGDVKHGRLLLKRFAHLIEPLRSPQLRLLLHIRSSMKLLRLCLSSCQTWKGLFFFLPTSSFPLRESIEAYVSDRFICDNINESTFIIKRMSHQGQFWNLFLCLCGIVIHAGIVKCTQVTYSRHHHAFIARK